MFTFGHSSALHGTNDFNFIIFLKKSTRVVGATHNRAIFRNRDSNGWRV